MSLQERFGACAGQGVTAIAAAFEDDDQDEVTRKLVELIAERTDPARLPHVPYRVGFTMYGDTGVSDWVVHHTAEGFEIEPASESDVLDVDSRWEHWEDAVRALNGDLSALSLYYARRITIGDEPTTDNEPPWLRAVDFAPGSQALAENRALTSVIIASEAGDKERDACIARIGLQAIVEARALSASRALLEGGCAEDLKGSYMAVTVDGEPDVLAVALIGDSTVELGAGIPSDMPGVTLPYAGREIFIAQCTGERTLQDLLVNGLVKVEGDDAARARFGGSLMNFARLHGIG